MNPNDTNTPPPTPPLDGLENDTALVKALLSGSESAYERLIAQYHGAMSRLAAVYLNDARLVEEALQDTWIGLLRGLKQFQGRSSLKTWLFSILVNRAKTLAQREGRYLLFEAPPDGDEEHPLADRFHPPDHEDADEWISIPRSWEDFPEERLLSMEIQEVIRRTIEGLPTHQREVITLRDLEGMPSEAVCNILAISETNQRVLLHRARTKVRLALEAYLMRSE